MFREEATPAFAGFHADPLSWSNWDLQFWFQWKEKNRRKPLEHIEPVSHWWEVSSLTSAPFLLPIREIDLYCPQSYRLLEITLWKAFFINFENGLCSFRTLLDSFIPLSDSFKFVLITELLLLYVSVLFWIDFPSIYIIVRSIKIL